MRAISWFVLALNIVVLKSCADKLPEAKYHSFELDIQKTIVDDTFHLKIVNPLKAPVKVQIRTGSTLDSSHFFGGALQVMPPEDSMLFHIVLDSLLKSTLKLDNVQVGTLLGNYEGVDSLVVLDWPFPRSRNYRIIQAYNGSYSHNTDYSRYALDFDLAIGDTICAALDGYVVGLVNQYEKSGNNSAWRPFANFMTLYHPKENIFTQYVHFSHKSNMVEMHDYVKAGDAIALSGNTGWTSVPHLHFNVLKSDSFQFVSMPAQFTGKLNGKNLKVKQTVGFTIESN